MYAPRPRPASRSSTLTILDSSPPSSWSERMQPSSRSSVFSDEGTAMPHEKESVTVVGGMDEEPLIDLGDEPVGGEPTPGDKLRMLLSQMDAEIRQATPVIPRLLSPVPSKEKDSGQGGWRDGRRRGFRKVDERSRSPSPPPSPEREEESPPTPPPRITRTFLHPTRRVSGERQRTPTPPAAAVRIPSRATALHASTSRPPPTPPSQPAHVPSPLETFIATHPAPPITRSSDPSSSRSFDRSSTSSGSRKGKERAPDPLARTPRPSRYAPVHSSTDLSDHQPRRRYPVTPRRVSVELAPDDSELFAKEAQGLEIGGEVELDLDEASGEPPPWEGTESEVDEEPDRTERASALSPPQPRRSSPLMRSREINLRSNTSAETSLRQPSSRETSYNSAEGIRSEDFTRLSRILSAPQRPLDELSIPALPDPDQSQAVDDDDEIDTLSSRRAALFRSTSRFSPRVSHSPSFASTRRGQELSIPPQDPVRVGMALLPSPRRSTPDRGGTTAVTTPHPPGRWQASPEATKGNVRFSPLGLSTSRDTNTSPGLVPGDSEVSVHRIKLSPAKIRPLSKRAQEEPKGSPDGDSSFIQCLSRAVTRRPIPPPSTALREAQSALSRAAEASSTAQAKVELTQRQWLEALAAVQNNTAVGVMRKSWSWGTWAWWICMEVLLVLGVFRVTLDYATSTHYLASLDPFAPTAFALSIPLPTAVSAFVIPHRGSANFFDLIERAELWRRLESWGVGVERVDLDAGGLRLGFEGVRMVGGVPT